MENRTTLLALCCVSLVILSATALNINDPTEDKVQDTGIAVKDVELEVGTEKTVEELPATQQLAVQSHAEEEVEVDTSTNADESLSSFTVNDTDGRSKFINNRYIPDDYSNFNQKPLFELLQEEANQQHPPKPLATRYNNIGASTAFYDKVRQKNTYRQPKPTQLPNYFSRPISQSSKANASNKGPSKFKTVSSSSQFIATPVANLLLKLEIGIAKPSEQIDDDDTVEIYQ